VLARVFHLIAVVLAGALIGASAGMAADEATELFIEIQTLHQQAAVESMHAPDKADIHVKWTAKRKADPEDDERAAQVVQTLRQAIEKYRDYRVALNKGFQPFQPNIPQPYYHFTKKLQGFKAPLSFDPAQPTTLLYRRAGRDYELIGAMYMASKDASERELHALVPLSVAQWHAHVNVCIPPKGKADWVKFGVRGSIATEAECKKAEGRFVPQLFGWMLPVFPFKATPEEIWGR
jgi:hypothetical protein